MNIPSFKILNLTNQVQSSSTQGFRENIYTQKPDSFTKTTPLNFTSKQTSDYHTVIKSLALTNNNATYSLNGQLATDGWSGKTADWVSGAWNSKNRAHLVKADIDAQKSQIKELKHSIKKNNFEAKFKEIFEINYDQNAINTYTNKAEEYKLAVTTKCIADITKEKLSKPLKDYKSNNGELKDKIETRLMPICPTGASPLYTVTKPKDEFLNNIKNSLIDVIGSEKRLNDLIDKNGGNIKNTTDEEKYKIYGSICDFLIETSSTTAEKCSSGKTIKELNAEYEETYQKAYGTKNNIQERVNKYNRSQEIGAATIKGVVRSGIVAATIATAGASSFIGGIAVGSGATFGAKIFAEVTDKMTNDIDNSKDLSKENLQKLVKSATISSANYIASKGLTSIIPNFETSSNVLNTILNTGKKATIDSATGVVAEYFKTDEWHTNQIIPRLLISSTFQHLGIDNSITEELMSLTKGGINQTMKKGLKDYDSVKEFILGTKIILDENYANDPIKYGELKILSSKNPEKYDEYICKLLETYIQEKSA